MSKKIVLIDGHSILNRAFYGVPVLTNRDNIPTNAVYGFLNIMWKLLEEEQPDYLAVAFDVKAPTFRHEMFADYKGTRKPMPDDLRVQVPLIKECLAAMKVPCLEKAGWEADDILGTIAGRCENLGMEVSVLSGDRDLLQLATEKVKICIPKTKAGKTETHYYHAAEVLAEYGVTPTEFIDVKALMGDTSDNIPGVPGIGEKTAAKIIATYHSIEEAMAHISEVKPPKAAKNLEEFYEQAKLSKVLAAINTHADIDFHPEEAVMDGLYSREAYEFIRRMNFKSMLSRFDLTEKQEETLPVEVISDFNDALLRMAQLKKEPSLGLFCAADESGIAGLSVSTGEQITFFKQEGFLTEYCLLGFLEELLSCPAVIYTLDLKQLLLLFDPIPVVRAHDVSLGAYLLNPLPASYEYEAVAETYLNKTFPTKKDVFAKLNMSQMLSEKEEALVAYCANNALTSLLAGPIILEKLKKEEMLPLYEELELPLVSCLARMEREGIAADAEELRRYGESLTEGIITLEQKIHEETGENFNILSPKQLGEVLFEKMKLPGGKKTKTGYSTSADVLDKLAPEYPVIRSILEYRQLTKLKSTYADGLAAFIEKDGKIRSKFQQMVTATGRLSSAEPNLQNIPVRMELGRKIRKIFRPKEGCVFVDADYSQIELRVLAAMSGDENLIAAYRDAADIHAATASQVFHVPLEEVTPELRRNAKAVNFGIVYGISAFGLSEDLSISRKEASQYIERYFETYPGVKHFLDHLVSSAKEKGYAVTYYGRKRPMPELSSSNFMQRSFGERVAMNAPIQGTAADIMKRAMLRVEEALLREGFQAKLILQIHDELLIEAPKEEAEAVKELLIREMKQAADLAVPLEVDAKIGNNWFETK